MAYKVFTNGSVLNASEMNEYLMNQSVITFSNSTARSSAITSPVEGMITYLEDTQTYESWDGTAWIRIVSESTGNAIINGAFEINQRGFTSTTTTATYGFDRFLLRTNDALCTYSAQTFSPGESPSTNFEGRSYARLVTAGQTAANTLSVLRQVIEDVRTFAGRTVTMSFYAKAASGSPKINISLTQSFGSGGSAFVEKFATPATLTTSWARYSFTLTLDPLTGKTVTTNTTLLASIFVSAGTDFAAAGTGIQSNTFDIWGVQLEEGTVATPFRRNANSIQGELAACQRYYVRFIDVIGNSILSSLGFASQTTSAHIMFTLPVEMRVRPTSVEHSAVEITDLVNEISVGTLTLSGNRTPFSGQVNCATSGLTQFRPYVIRNDNNAAGFVAFSAEL